MILRLAFPIFLCTISCIASDQMTDNAKVERQAIKQANVADEPFRLREEWKGPCQQSQGTIDVNLGNSPEVFLQAAACQIWGKQPDAATVRFYVAWVVQIIERSCRKSFRRSPLRNFRN
jgi:hypothetical protein